MQLRDGAVVGEQWVPGTIPADDGERQPLTGDARTRAVEEWLLHLTYLGDDDRSMAANNTSAYNCRTVAEQSSFSAHAYGAAVDLDPVENPYVTRDDVAPEAGRKLVELDRSPGGDGPRGAIVADDVVVRAFAGSAGRGAGRGPTPTSSTSSPPETAPDTSAGETAAVTPSDEYPLYGDQQAGTPPEPEPRVGHAAPPCPSCGSNEHEDGFVESTSDSLVRYYAGRRETGFFGVKRFGVERRTVIARRCLGCSRLDLYAGDVTV